MTSLDLWLTTVNGVLYLAVLTLPLALLAAWALARHRTARGTPAALARRTAWAEVGMVHGTVPLVWLTLLPGSGAGLVPGRVSLVPLRDLATMDDFQVVGNLLLLAALGLLVPVRFPRLATFPRVLAAGVAASTLIEVAQYALRLDRVSSVDDVLLNATGAMLASALSRPWWAGARIRREEVIWVM